MNKVLKIKDLKLNFLKEKPIEIEMIWEWKYPKGAKTVCVVKKIDNYSITICYLKDEHLSFHRRVIDLENEDKRGIITYKGKLGKLTRILYL
jgi:hypothetical protein